MSFALPGAIPFIPPQPTAVPAQVQVAQGASVPVPEAAVTASDRGNDAGETKDETGGRSEENDGRRGKLIDISA